jgi:catechol 2,3-dioxygenase-like lactoylglutathione lyase family enzyme
MVQLNHHIVYVRDREAAAAFYHEILGLELAGRLGPFVAVEPSNDVTLDLMSVGDAPIAAQHYAFLVSDGEFDEIFERIKERRMPYWADPFHHRPGEHNTDWGGRGVYFEDLDGHNLEILTKPYVLE